MRALIRITLCIGLYGEVVRVACKQSERSYEAASALGWAYCAKTGLVVLPQALTLVIPGSSTPSFPYSKTPRWSSLLAGFDIFGRRAVDQYTDPAWRNVTDGSLRLVAFCFLWIFCFGMSRYSQIPEAKYSSTVHKNLTGHQHD